VLAGFTLYLGLFRITEAEEIIHRFFDELSPAEREEERQRGQMPNPGRSCVASIELDARGRPRSDLIGLSTLPWALGRLASEGLQGLDFDRYLEAEESCRSLLQDFAPAAPCAAGSPWGRWKPISIRPATKSA